MPPKYKKTCKPKTSFKKKKYTKMVGKQKISSIGNMFRNYLSNTMMSYKLNCPLPDAFRTILTCDWTSCESAAAGAAVDFQVWASQCLLPFQVSASLIGSTACINAPGTGIDTGSTSTATRNCQALSRLFNKTPGSTIYKQVHVINSYIAVSYIPQISGDSLSLCVGPQRDSDSQPVGSIQSAYLPGWKQGDCQTLTPRKDCTVYNKINIPKYLGMTEAAYLSSSLTATGVNANAGTYIYPANTASGGGQVFWTIRRALIDGNTNTNVLPYEIKIKYDVLFTQLCDEDIPST